MFVIKRVRNIICNWALMLTAPVWVIPAFIHANFKDRTLVSSYINGKNSHVKSQWDVE
jgi:hypothetical protein